MGRGVIQDANQAVKRNRQADGIKTGKAYIGRLDGPLADAIIRVRRTVAGSGALRRAAGRVCVVRDVTGLGRTAYERAGQEEAGQE